MTGLRVVVAEDSFVVRTGLIELLTDRGHDVVAAVGDPDALLAAVETHRPAVAIVDVRMPPTHSDEGLRAALRIRASLPDVGILVFSQYIETRYARELPDTGAAGVGYLLKDRVADAAEFTDAVERVAGGGTALDAEVVSQLLGAKARASGLTGLTPWERDVLALIAEGRSNGAIGTALAIFLQCGREAHRQHPHESRPRAVR